MLNMVHEAMLCLIRVGAAGDANTSRPRRMCSGINSQNLDRQSVLRILTSHCDVVGGLCDEAGRLLA